MLSTNISAYVVDANESTADSTHPKNANTTVNDFLLYKTRRQSSAVNTAIGNAKITKVNRTNIPTLKRDAMMLLNMKDFNGNSRKRNFLKDCIIQILYAVVV